MMAGATEGLLNASRRVKKLEAEMKRAKTFAEREAIKPRLAVALQDRAAAFRELGAAAKRGDAEAKRLIDVFKSAITRD
jgi:hypothetical protein